MSNAEINQKLRLFTALRPQCVDFEEAMIEVLAEIFEFIAGGWYTKRKKKPLETNEENSSE